MAFRCNNCVQIICTTWCILSLLILAVATVLTYRAVESLIPTVIDMPQTIQEGFDHLLNFEKMEESAATVKNFSKQALSKCQITEPELGCASELPLNPDTYNATDDVESLVGLDTHNVSAEVDGISMAFTDVLDEIEKVTTDKYFGFADFNTTAKSLKEIKAELEKFQGENGTAPCIAITEAFCPIFKNADQLREGMNTVHEAIDMIINNKAVQALEKQEPRLRALRLLPVFAWVGVIFYICFFCSPKAVTICRGGSTRACAAISCYSIFILVFFAICIVITGFALAGSQMARDFELPEPFVNEPTVEELVDHIEVKFPEFYNLVLKDFISALKDVRSAFLLNTFACCFIFLHTYSSCCFGVYSDSSNSEERK